MRIYSRSHWSARHDDGVGPARLPAQLYLHHSVTTPSSSTVAAEVAHMRHLEAIGEQRFGSGISYTWVAFPSGRVWQGHSVDREGTHTYGHNSVGRGICLVGNFETSVPPAAMIRSVVELVAEARRQGWATDADMLGHRDVRQTACPGIYAYRLLPDINDRSRDMALSTEDKAWIVDNVMRPTVRLLSDGDADQRWTGQTIKKARQDIAALRNLIAERRGLTPEDITAAVRAAMPDADELAGLLAEAVAERVDHELDTASVREVLREALHDMLSGIPEDEENTQ